MPPIYSQMRVLVVDDNGFTRKLICEVLHNLGVELDNLAEASDGAAALNILKTQAFDLIISDWHMKPMDGLTFTRKIRDPLASPAPDTPVILCTADPQRDVITRALQMGVNQVIAKPIVIANFDKRIRMMFDSIPASVTSRDYVGPDRRTDQDAPHPIERRAAVQGERAKDTSN